MATKIVGKLGDWGDGDVGGNDFMKLIEGEEGNPIRMITSPYQFYSHWTQDATGADRKVRCAMDGCPLCQRGEKATARWLVGIIDRKSGKPAVLEIGPQIFKGVLSLSKKAKWGDPRKYDLSIERKPKNSQPLYVVTPEPKAPLSDEDKSMAKEFLARVDLTKMSAAATVEEVCEAVGLKAAKTESAVDNSFGDSDDDSTTAAVEVPAEETSSDSDDFDFESN